MNHDLDRFVAARSAQGSPIFYVQIGRLFEERHRWDRLVHLLGAMPARFVVDLGRSDYLTDHSEFPDNFYLHPFIPMGYVKDEITGIICSGQTTSVLSALFHGKAVLGIPNSGDGARSHAELSITASGSAFSILASWTSSLYRTFSTARRKAISTPTSCFNGRDFMPMTTTINCSPRYSHEPDDRLHFA